MIFNCFAANFVMKWCFLQKCFGCVLHDFVRWVICKTFVNEKNVRCYLRVKRVCTIIRSAIKVVKTSFAKFLNSVQNKLQEIIFLIQKLTSLTNNPHTMQQRSLPCVTNVSCANIELSRNRVLLKKFAKNQQNLSGAINPSVACFVLGLPRFSRMSRTCWSEEFAKS